MAAILDFNPHSVKNLCYGYIYVTEQPEYYHYANTDLHIGATSCIYRGSPLFNRFMVAILRFEVTQCNLETQKCFYWPGH